MKHLTNIIIAGFVSLLLIFATPASMVLANSAGLEPSSASSCEGLLITQLQAGTQSRSLNEYIELHNNTLSKLELDSCSVGFYDQNLELRIDVQLTGELEAGGYLLVIHNSFVNFMTQNDISVPSPYIIYANQSGQGSINAVQATSGLVDIRHSLNGIVETVYYGPFSELSSAPKIDTGRAIKRCSLPSGFYRSVDDSLDFYLSGLPDAENPYPGLDLLFDAGDLCEPIEGEDGGSIDSEEPPTSEDPEQPEDDGSSSGSEPSEGNNQEDTNPGEEEPTSDPVEDPASSLPSCSQLMITEILPNPAGADKGKEFIEIHNKSKDIHNLEGCGLQVVGNAKKFVFGDVLIDAREYIAFYDGLTSLVLPNTSGGTVLWLDVDGSILQSISYPGGLKDDVSWAWFEGGVWTEAAIITPGSKNVSLEDISCPAGYFKSDSSKECEKPPETGNGNDGDSGLKPCLPHQERNPETNRCRAIVMPKSLVPCKPGQYRNPETNRCRAIGKEQPALAPCKPGQFRNPETNRCKSLSATASTLKPCKPGQYRNPETNRCKSTAESASGLKPCKPGQFRNPETNRCKSLEAAGGLKPCKPGQERNPETNRCRKVAVEAVGNLATVHDIEAIREQPVRWWTAGIALSAVVVYALWEWRSDVMVRFARIRKLANKSSK
jgi:hypothetical protein